MSNQVTSWPVNLNIKNRDKILQKMFSFGNTILTSIDLSSFFKWHTAAVLRVDLKRTLIAALHSFELHNVGTDLLLISASLAIVHGSRVCQLALHSWLTKLAENAMTVLGVIDYSFGGIVDGNVIEDLNHVVKLAYDNSSQTLLGIPDVAAEVVCIPHLDLFRQLLGVLSGLRESRAFSFTGDRNEMKLSEWGSNMLSILFDHSNKKMADQRVSCFETMGP